jgi:hypothetical protein
VGVERDHGGEDGEGNAALRDEGGRVLLQIVHTVAARVSIVRGVAYYGTAIQRVPVTGDSQLESTFQVVELVIPSSGRMCRWRRSDTQHPVTRRAKLPSKFGRGVRTLNLALVVVCSLVERVGSVRLAKIWCIRSDLVILLNRS